MAGLRSLRKQRADLLIAIEIVFTAPTIEAETLGAALLAAAEHDGTGIAQPDVAERLDDDFGERGKPARGFGGALVGRHQPHLLAFPARMDRLGEGCDFPLGRLQVPQPQLGIAWESDPDRLVRRPFGRRGKEGRIRHLPRR